MVKLQFSLRLLSLALPAMTPEALKFSRYLNDILLFFSAQWENSMQDIFDAPGDKVIFKAEDWYSSVEDLIEWNWCANITPTEILYVGHTNSKDESTAFKLHKLSFLSADGKDLAVEYLGVHTSPVTALIAARLTIFHDISRKIIKFFDD